jgi:hypothetical protein
MERMMQELREPQPGGFLIAQHLAYMMLVQALRLHLAEGLRGGVVHRVDRRAHLFICQGKQPPNAAPPALYAWLIAALVSTTV